MYITKSLIYSDQFSQTAFKNIFVGVLSKLFEASFDFNQGTFSKLVYFIANWSGAKMH